jgi:hypothetical protein
MSLHGRSPKEIASDDTVMAVPEGSNEVASRFFSDEEDDQRRTALCEAIEALLDAAPGPQTLPGCKRAGSHKPSGRGRSSSIGVDRGSL